MKVVNKKDKSSSSAKKKYKTVVSGKAYIKASFNNTIISLTDLFGNVICASSAGVMGFKGARKATPYAAQVTSEFVIKQAQERFNLQNIDIIVSGPGPGRESAIRGLAHASGISVQEIYDNTPVPHNGTKPRKQRRV